MLSSSRLVVTNGVRYAKRVRLPVVSSGRHVVKYHVGKALATAFTPNLNSTSFTACSGVSYPTVPQCRFLSSSSSIEEEEVESDNDELVLPKFEEMDDLHPSSKRALRQMGLETASEIQAKTWIPALEGHDVLGRARTGTGKTLAFLLPSIERLVQQKESNDKQAIRMLVLSPTRELALQIAEQTRALVTAHNQGNTKKNLTKRSAPLLSHQVMLGGSSRQEDVRKLQRRLPDILVATPGRLQDHLQSTEIGKQSFASLVHNVDILVLDETDRLLDMGFRKEVETILTCLSPDKQTLLFSATLPPEVRSVLRDNLKSDFTTVDCIHETDTATHVNAQVSQSHVIVPVSQLVTATTQLLSELIVQKHKIMVFFPTTHLVRFYSNLFNFGLGQPVLELHSKKSQSYRTSASNRFRELKSGALFTSDVSARGVDYPDVTHVVQVGMSENRETYIHRLGRTGRANKEGQGLLVLSDLERGFLSSHLEDLEIPFHPELQQVVETPTFMQDLEPIWNSIRQGQNVELRSSVEDAYRSMLGFYLARLRQVGVKSHKQKLVELVNSFSLQVGLVEPPSIKYKTARNMGLENVPGIRIGNANDSGGGGSKMAHGRKRQGGRSQSARNFEKQWGGGGSLSGQGSYDDWGRSKDISNRYPLPDFDKKR